MVQWIGRLASIENDAGSTPAEGAVICIKWKVAKESKETDNRRE